MDQHAFEDDLGRSSHDPETLTALVVDLLNAAGEALENDREVAGAYIQRASALLRARRIARAEAGKREVAQGGLAAWQMRRVAAYVDARLTSKLTIKDIAATTGLSTSHFGRSFKASFRETPFEYIARRRIERAKQMMRSTDLPLSEIALACGLYDQSHFTHVFRRVAGVSPNVWRRNQCVASAPGLRRRQTPEGSAPSLRASAWPLAYPSC